ncbi:hypothetical protein NQ317_018504 [Molorchus minor]|uniref:DDE Tnp4 domain-containing protein n=1 Tax=Molorchus minor TaxID=1323400 RepID=A0ABQ9J9A7_9CUCU|nr:hypothetical protein NQ317_018504 [Molorchus minor]
MVIWVRKQMEFPHCLGAIDGKHVEIIPPSGTGLYFYNYKGKHSMVLMAIANANYEFIIGLVAERRSDSTLNCRSPSPLLTKVSASGSYTSNVEGGNKHILNTNIMCDFGTNGRISDGGVLENTVFGID